jgi:hypothetical protein
METSFLKITNSIEGRRFLKKEKQLVLTKKGELSFLSNKRRIKLPL